MVRQMNWINEIMIHQLCCQEKAVRRQAGDGTIESVSDICVLTFLRHRIYIRSHVVGAVFCHMVLQHGKVPQ